MEIKINILSDEIKKLESVIDRKIEDDYDVVFAIHDVIDKLKGEPHESNKRRI